jgi:hypothetical protein
VVIPTFTIENVVVDGSVTIWPRTSRPIRSSSPRWGRAARWASVHAGGHHQLRSAGGVFGHPPILPTSSARQIAIRLESPQGYFSYNWFWNNLAEPAPTPIPTLSIESVVVDETVTIRTHNFPPDTTFLITMGHMGTLGIDGTPVGTLYSGPGGEMTATFPIPVLLKGLERIAIRAQSNPFYAYNWFDNQTEPLPTPTFAICGVRDSSWSSATATSRPTATPRDGQRHGHTGDKRHGGRRFNPPRGAIPVSFPIPSNARPGTRSPSAPVSGRAVLQLLR